MEKTNVTTTETTNVTPPAAKRRYWWKAIASFLMVLFTMPLGHGLMIIMEHLMSETVLHYSAFVMGAVGMAMVIRQRRYAPNTLGILRRSALLDRLGGISLHVFCQPFRHAAGTRPCDG